MSGPISLLTKKEAIILSIIAVGITGGAIYFALWVCSKIH